MSSPGNSKNKHESPDTLIDSETCKKPTSLFDLNFTREQVEEIVKQVEDEEKIADSIEEAEGNPIIFEIDHNNMTLLVNNLNNYLAPGGPGTAPGAIAPPFQIDFPETVNSFIDKLLLQIREVSRDSKSRVDGKIAKEFPNPIGRFCLPGSLQQFAIMLGVIYEIGGHAFWNEIDKGASTMMPIFTLWTPRPGSEIGILDRIKGGSVTLFN